MIKSIGQRKGFMGVRPYIGHDKSIGQRKGSIQKVCLSQVD